MLRPVPPWPMQVKVVSKLAVMSGSEGGEDSAVSTAYPFGSSASVSAASRSSFSSAEAPAAGVPAAAAAPPAAGPLQLPASASAAGVGLRPLVTELPAGVLLPAAATVGAAVAVRAAVALAAAVVAAVVALAAAATVVATGALAAALFALFLLLLLEQAASSASAASGTASFCVRERSSIICPFGRTVHAGPTPGTARAHTGYGSTARYFHPAAHVARRTPGQPRFAPLPAAGAGDERDPARLRPTGPRPSSSRRASAPAPRSRLCSWGRGC